MFKKNIIIEDTTLRDGEQAPGVAFSSKTKIKIFSKLIESGITWIEPGIAAMGGDEIFALSEMLERKEEAVLVGWNRGNLEDIRSSIDLGFDAIHIGLPTSDLHIKESIEKDRSWVMKKAIDLIKYAKDREVFVSISAEDVGRTDMTFLKDYANAVHEAGADRLRLSDTVGILTPEKYGFIVEAVSQASEIDLQCHCHNDFGLALANTISGLKAGARYFHVCVNSMGERAGMADLAQSALTLKHLYNIDLSIKFEKLKELSLMVAKASHCNVPPWQPVVGDNVFSHESGIHVKGMLNDFSTFEPFPPEEVGGNRKFIIGKHSGRAAIRYALESQGLQVQEEVLTNCLYKVREYATRQEKALTTGQLIFIYKNLIHATRKI